MALRVPCPVLLLPLVLLATCLVLASGQSCIEQNFNFIRKHVDYPKTPAPNPNTYCNMIMLSRGLFGKAVNTFIHEPVSKINSICLEGGKPKPCGSYESKDPFSITQCIFDPKPNSVSISYIGKEKKMKITIRCCEGYPACYLEKI